MLYRGVGRASTVLDGVRPWLRRGRPAPEGQGRDRTGLLVSSATKLPILWRDETVIYARYDSVAHSFWRAQELSLIRLHADRLAEPRMDFGAGDGSFASVLFEKVAIGVDTDPEALAIAKAWGVYERLLQSRTTSIPLGDGEAGSIFTNSVLEHIGALDDVLAELARVLRPKGMLALTVPLRRFAEHLTFYFGKTASDRVNEESSHHNLLHESEWLARLETHGLRPVVVRQYQPDWFTFWYRMLRLLGPRGLGRIPGAQELFWRQRGRRLVEMVRTSITSTTLGANLFVLAERA